MRGECALASRSGELFFTFLVTELTPVLAYFELNLESLVALLLIERSIRVSSIFESGRVSVCRTDLSVVPVPSEEFYVFLASLAAVYHSL